MNPVQQIGVGNKRYPSGFCYLIIPSGVDRDRYVKNCYRTGRVAVLMDDGSFLPSIPIGLSILKEVDFPEKIEQLGSQLVWVNHTVHNQPIIIDRILKDDEANNFIENEFKLEKYTEEGSVSISGVAKEGNLYISVDGKTSKGGKIFIDVGNSDEEGAVIFNIKGDLKAELNNLICNAIKDVIINSKEDITINPTEDGKKVKLGTGDEPILKGDSSVTQLDTLQAKVDLIIDAIKNGTIGSSDGGAAYKSSMVLILEAAIDADFSNIKSDKSFTE